MKKINKILFGFICMFLINVLNVKCFYLYVPNGYNGKGYQVSSGVFGSYGGTKAYCYQYQNKDTKQNLYCLSPAGAGGSTSNLSSKTIDSASYSTYRTITSSNCNASNNECKFINVVKYIMDSGAAYCDKVYALRNASYYYMNNLYSVRAGKDYGAESNKLALFKSTNWLFNNARDNTSSSGSGTAINYEEPKVTNVYVNNTDYISVVVDGVKAVNDSNLKPDEVKIVYSNPKSYNMNQVIAGDGLSIDYDKSNTTLTLTIKNLESLTVRQKYNVDVAFEKVSVKTSGVKVSIYSTGISTYQYFLGYDGTYDDTIDYQKKSLIEITPLCKECNIKLIEPPKPSKDCSVDNNAVIKEPELCAIIPKCGIDTENSKNYKQDISTGTCRVYCTDEIDFKLFDKKYIYDNFDNLMTGTIMAGRGFVFSVSGPEGNKETGILHVKRSCALIPTTNGGCTKADVERVTSQKPVSCDDLITMFDYHQDYNEQVREMLNDSLSGQNKFDVYNYYSYNNNYEEYCGTGTCAGDMVNAKKSSQDINAIDYSGAIKVQMETSDISIKLNKNFYQKAYTGEIGTTALSGWYKLPDAFYPVSDDTESSKQEYDINMFYTCLGSGKKTKQSKFEYNCKYVVKNYTTRFTCDNLDSDYTCFYKPSSGEDNNPELAFFYRTVDLTQVIPTSRTTDSGNQIIGVNWSEALSDGKVKLNATGSLLESDGRTEVSENLWSSTPEYTVLITPGGIKEIKEYNESVNRNYQNETIDCSKGSDGYCVSNVLNKFNESDNISISKSGSYKDNLYTKNLYTGR